MLRYIINRFLKNQQKNQNKIFKNQLLTKI